MSRLNVWRDAVSRWWMLVVAALTLPMASAAYWFLPGRVGEFAALELSIAAALLGLLFGVREMSRASRHRKSSGRVKWPSGPDLTSITFIGLTGLAMAYHFDERSDLRFLHHIGIGLLVAATVSVFWQLSEMKNFFADLAVAVMVEARYLQKLHVDDLRVMREKSIHAIFHRQVTNPAYEIEACAQWIDALLIGNILPVDGEGSGLYRTDLRERVAIQLMTLGDVWDSIGINPGTPEERSIPLVKQTTVATFRVVSPQLSADRYPVRLIYAASQIPHLADEQRIHFRVGTSQADAEDVAMAITGKPDPNGGVTLEGKRELPFKEGLCDVWTEVVEYRSAESESWVFNTLGTLTYRLDAHVYLVGAADHWKFEGNLMGGLGSEPRKTHLPNGIAFHYDGWLLEDHGYFVWWWREEMKSLVKSLQAPVSEMPLPRLSERDAG